MTSLVQRLWLNGILDTQSSSLDRVLVDIGREVGVPPEDCSPHRVLLAVQGLREALNRAKGYSGTPKDADGRSVPFCVAGR